MQTTKIQTTEHSPCHAKGIRTGVMSRTRPAWRNIATWFGRKQQRATPVSGHLYTNTSYKAIYWTNRERRFNSINWRPAPGHTIANESTVRIERPFAPLQTKHPGAER